MGFKPLIWYCKPESNEVWASVVDSSFGSYTPCAVDSLVNSITHLVLLGLCLYRIWLIKCNFKAKRFRLRSNFYNYMLGILAGYCTAEPLLRLVMDISIFNLGGQTGLAPFEVGFLSNCLYCLCCLLVSICSLLVHYDYGCILNLQNYFFPSQTTSLIIETLAWCAMLIMIGLETKVYIKEFRWYVRFGVIYVLAADAVVLNLILSITDYYSRLVAFHLLNKYLIVSTLTFLLYLSTLRILEPENVGILCFPLHLPITEPQDLDYK